ncbi:hypothetical protein [Coprobacter sp.]
MKRVHIISLGDAYMFRLAVALQEKGYSVSCSGVDIVGTEADILREKNILLADLQPVSDPFKEKVDLVVAPLQSVPDHPELVRAKESGLLILSVPELVLRMAKDKIRLVFCNPRHPNRIMSTVLKAFRKQNMRCDYVALNEIPGQEKRVSLSYDARISLLEGDAFLEEEPLTHQLYKPHILIMADLLWHPTKTHATFESYVDFWKGMVSSIERDGKFIYNQNIPLLQELADTVRDDITAVPYLPHPIMKIGDSVELETRYGQIPVVLPDEEFLGDINAARLACRHLGVNDKEFYTIFTELVKSS